MSFSKRCVWAISVGVISLVAGAAPGDLLHSFQDPTPASDENFGDAVAAYGTALAVGATYENTDGLNVGRAYVFDSGTGNLVLPVAHPAPVAGDFFGSAAAWAADGSSLYISAPGRDSGTLTQVGAVYKMNASTGAMESVITHPEPADSAFFGGSISVSGSRIVIGSPARNRVYLFSTDRTFIATINPALESAGFGYSIVQIGNKIVIGAPQYALNTGRVYIYSEDGAFERIIESPSGTDGGFGFSIANLNGDILVSSWYAKVGNENAGIVYVYSLDGTQRLEIPNPTPKSGDQFGRSVAVVGNHIAVGAGLDDTAATDAGAVYIFDSTSGALKRTITNPQTDSWNYGYALAPAGVNLLVGAPGNNTGTIWGGRAYLYHDPALPVSLSTFTLD